MNADELKIVLENHKKWLLNENEGERADLSEADLRKANLRKANLRRADLRGANLRRADLSVANLNGADLSRADLSVANLIGADLIGANLSGANLIRADLSVADLRGADLRGADIDYACWPLWCSSKGVKVDARIAMQLAAHFCVLDCDDQEYQAARAAILGFAQKSHRAADLGLVS